MKFLNLCDCGYDVVCIVTIRQTDQMKPFRDLSPHSDAWSAFASSIRFWFGRRYCHWRAATTWNQIKCICITNSLSDHENTTKGWNHILIDLQLPIKSLNNLQTSKHMKAQEIRIQVWPSGGWQWQHTSMKLKELWSGDVVNIECWLRCRQPLQSPTTQFDKFLIKSVSALWANLHEILF